MENEKKRQIRYWILYTIAGVAIGIAMSIMLDSAAGLGMAAGHISLAARWHYQRKY